MKKILAMLKKKNTISYIQYIHIDKDIYGKLIFEQKKSSAIDNTYLNGIHPHYTYTRNASTQHTHTHTNNITMTFYYTEICYILYVMCMYK